MFLGLPFKIVSTATNRTKKELKASNAFQQSRRITLQYGFLVKKRLSRISPSWRLEPWNRDHVTYHVITGGPCARPLKTLRALRTPVNLDLPSLVLN